MPQLHCYVPETIAQQLHRQAADLGLSLSAYLAELVKRDISPGWPEGFEAALFGARVEASPLALESAGLPEDRIELL